MSEDNQRLRPIQGDPVITSQGKKLARIEFPPKKNKPDYPHPNPAVTFSFTPHTRTLHFRAEVPTGTWLSLGWGWHMFDVDMWVAQAYPDIRRSFVSDLWSIKNVTPIFDTLDDYFDIHIAADPERKDMQIFTFSRAMDTGDEMQDYVVVMNKEIKICYAVNMMTPDFV